MVLFNFLFLFKSVINIKTKIIRLIPNTLVPTILTPIPANPPINIKPIRCVMIPKIKRTNGEIYIFLLCLITQTKPQILSNEIAIGK